MHSNKLQQTVLEFQKVQGDSFLIWNEDKDKNLFSLIYLFVKSSDKNSVST